jgi:hypothetical protein
MLLFYQPLPYGTLTGPFLFLQSDLSNAAAAQRSAALFCFFLKKTIKQGPLREGEEKLEYLAKVS